MEDITVLVLAGGKSQRFWPLEDKNLLTFCGKKLIEYQVEKIREAGFPKIAVVCNRDNIERMKDIAKTPVILQEYPGQAGAILSASKMIKTNKILIVNANDIVEVSLYREIRKWVNSPHSQAVVCGFKTDHYIPGGYYSFDKSDKISQVIEKPGEDNMPSNIVRIVVDYFQNFKVLLDYLKKAKTKKDDLYEVAMDRMIKDGIKFSLIKYQDYWGILKYPWQVLSLMDFFLKKVNRVTIKKNVKIARSATFSGPVFFDDNVRIMENVKIVGPCYLGKNTIIGNNCLVRNSMIGGNCLIGFSSDITRSYLADNVWLHTNYIGDSVLSDNVSLGSGAVTANLRMDEKEIKSLVNGDKIATLKNKLGVIIGKNSRIGVNSSIMPGVKIGKNSFVGPGIVIEKDIPDNKFCFGKFDLLITNNKFPEIFSSKSEFRKQMTH